MVDMLTIAMLVAASLPGTYDCNIDRQAAITGEGANNQQVMFPESDRANWRFALRVQGGRQPSVTIDWPADPIQIAGEHPALPLAPGQIALATTSGGPCMFTEAACMALVELSVREDGSLAFSILPAGSSRDASGTRSILHVAFLGTCSRRSGASS